MTTQIKKDIINLVKKTNDSSNLVDVYNLLHKKIIFEKVDRFLSTKGLNYTKNVEFLTNLILFRSLASMQEKIDFCDALMDNHNLIKYNVFLIKGCKDLIKGSKLYNFQVFHDIKTQIMNKTQFRGFGTAQLGKGEVFLTLFGKNVSKGIKGDLSVDNKEIEVKGTNCVCRGMKGYNAPKNTNPKALFEQHFHAELDTTKISLKKWKNFNKVLDKNEIPKPSVYDFLNILFSGFYTDSDKFKTISKDWLPKMIDNCGRFHKDSLNYLTALQIDYYKAIEGFESILFINPNTFQGIVISNGQDFIEHSDKFRIGGYSWMSAESRGSCNVISYNG